MSIQTLDTHEEEFSKLSLPLGLELTDITCPICVETISDPFVTSCGHTFCYQCITTQLKHRKSCPSCSSFLTPEHIYPNFLLSKVLRQAAFASSRQGTTIIDSLQHVLTDSAASGALRLSDIHTAIELLHEKRDELESQESTDKLHLLLLFLEHARTHFASRQQELEGQLQLLANDLNDIASRADANAIANGYANGHASPLGMTPGTLLSSPLSTATSPNQRSRQLHLHTLGANSLSSIAFTLNGQDPAADAALFSSALQAATAAARAESASQQAGQAQGSQHTLTIEEVQGTEQEKEAMGQPRLATPTKATATANATPAGAGQASMGVAAGPATSGAAAGASMGPPVAAGMSVRPLRVCDRSQQAQQPHQAGASGTAGASHTVAGSAGATFATPMDEGAGESPPKGSAPNGSGASVYSSNRQAMAGSGPTSSAGAAAQRSGPPAQMHSAHVQHAAQGAQAATQQQQEQQHWRSYNAARPVGSMQAPGAVWHAGQDISGTSPASNAGHAAAAAAAIRNGSAGNDEHMSQIHAHGAARVQPGAITSAAAPSVSGMVSDNLSEPSSERGGSDQALKKRRMLSQLDVLGEAYMQMRARSAQGHDMSTTHCSDESGLSQPHNSVGSGEAQSTPNPLSASYERPQRTTSASQGNLTFTPAFNRTVHGPMAFAGFDPGPALAGRAGPGGVPLPLSAFSRVLTTATAYSRLGVVADIPRAPIGGAGGGTRIGVNTGASSGRPASTSAHILQSVEFDSSGEVFAAAGVAPRVLLYRYSDILAKPHAVHVPAAELHARSKLSCVSWSSAVSSQLGVSDYEGCVTIWDTTTGQQVHDVSAHDKRIWSLHYSPLSPGEFATGSDDGTVKVWSAGADKASLSLNVQANVCSVQYSPGAAHMLALGCAAHTAMVYDLRMPSGPLATLTGHRKAVSYVRWLGGGHGSGSSHSHGHGGGSELELVTASTDGTLRLWSARDWSHVRTFTGHTNERNFVGLGVADDFIACGSETNELFVYYKAISRPTMSYSFNAGPEAPAGAFVSAVSWRGSDATLLAANSVGNIWVMSLQA